MRCLPADKPLKFPPLSNTPPACACAAAGTSSPYKGRARILAHRKNLLTGLAASLIVCLSGLNAQAVAPLDTLFPASTKGFVSIADLPQLNENWQRTQLGQMVQDEAMRPFIEDLKRQLQRKVGSFQDKLGLRLEDLYGIAEGELGVGLVARTDEPAAVLLVVDATGKRNRVEALLDKVDKQLRSRGAEVASENFSGAQLTRYTVPPQREGGAPHDAVFFFHNDLLCGSDNIDEARALLIRMGGSRNDSLAGVGPYRETMSRCAEQSHGLAPELRWFVDPFGYAHASRSLTPDKKRRGKDYVQIFESQGFDAITGIGGYINMAHDGYEILHRTAIYAPPMRGQTDKYKLAMRIMEFPNEQSMKPHEWIPEKLATHRTFNLDMQNAFRHFDTLFDAIVGYEGAFEGVLEGFREDPLGPKVNIEDEFIVHLGKRVTLLTDYKLPITTKSERSLVAIEVLDSATVAKTVEKFMLQDPNAVRRTYQGHTVWEITVPEHDVPELDIGTSDLDLLGPPEPETGPLGRPVDLGWAVCVAYDHLLIGSHLEFLEQVIDQNKQKQLVHSGDYRDVEALLSQLLPGEAAARSFLRTDEAYRPTYELLRQGKMPESETLLGRLLNRMLTPPEDEDEGILREQKIDGRALPAFDQVRRYFGPAGTVVRSEKDGWFISGATLNNTPAQAREDSSSRSNFGTMR